MRRIALAVVFALLAVPIALAANVTATTGSDGSITFHVTGEGIRSFHVWTPPGTVPRGTQDPATDGASGDPLAGWQRGTEVGARGNGWTWSNPGTNAAPLGPDGGTFTIHPSWSAATSGAFPGLWSTDDDGKTAFPPRGSGPWSANTEDHGFAVDPGGRPLPLPIRGVTLTFPEHGGGGVCACSPAEPLAGQIEAFGVDPASEAGVYRVVVRTALAPAAERSALSAPSGRRRPGADVEAFGLAQTARVPDSWALVVDGLAGPLSGIAGVTFRVGERSLGRGRRVYAVVVADFDGDGVPDAWSLPEEIALR